jgi:hypothetical protein
MALFPAPFPAPFLRRLPLCALLSLHALAASAADLPTSTLSTGDLIILRSMADKFEPVLKVDEARGRGAVFAAPPRTKLKVNQDRNGTLTVVVKDVPCAQDAAGTRTVPVLSRTAQVFSSITVSPDDCAASPLVTEGHAYTIKTEELEKFGFRRLGFIYGGLIIPYKYFRHDKSLEPGTTIGPFLGYRLGQTGWGVALVATYAVADIKVKVVQGTELKERTFFALSRGVGLMFDITKSETPFRAGIMWGKDRVGSNNVDVYPHDGRTWVAAQLGWEFGR